MEINIWSQLRFYFPFYHIFSTWFNNRWSNLWYNDTFSCKHFSCNNRNEVGDGITIHLKRDSLNFQGNVSIKSLSGIIYLQIFQQEIVFERKIQKIGRPWSTSTVRWSQSPKKNRMKNTVQLRNVECTILLVILCIHSLA